MRVKFLMLIILLFFLVGCVGLTVKEPDQDKIAYGIGYTASYMVLKNNSDQIPKVEPAIRGALEMLDEDGVDIVVMISNIMDFSTGLLSGIKADYANATKGAIKSFGGMVTLDFDIPENYGKAVRLTREFLKGALLGLEDARLATEG